MGDGIVGHITKGPVHQRVDDYVNHRDSHGHFDNRVEFLRKLMEPANTSAAHYLGLLENLVRVPTSDVNYLAQTWYDDIRPMWWPSLQPIYPILNAGLIKALQEAGSELLLDSYWMPVAGAPMLAVVTAKSAVQVTRVIVTPRSPATTRPRSVDAPMWVITPQPSPPVHVGDRTDDARVLSVQGLIVTWQQLEFPLHEQRVIYRS